MEFEADATCARHWPCAFLSPRRNPDPENRAPWKQKRPASHGW